MYTFYAVSCSHTYKIITNTITEYEIFALYVNIPCLFYIKPLYIPPEELSLI